MRQLILLMFVAIISAMSACSNSNSSSTQINVDAAFKTQTLLNDGPLGVIWALDFVDENTLIFTTKTGRIGLLTIAKDSSPSQPVWLSGVPTISIDGQGGLLDIAVLPTDASVTSKTIYTTYVKPAGNEQTTVVLARAILNTATNTLENWQELFVADAVSDTGRHFGSRIAFEQSGDTGYVYFTIGDRGVRENAQLLTNHAGKVLRLHLDGSVPSNNPFVNDAAAKDEIWSYGHRNPQGICFDEFGQLWANEHGPRGGDEINKIDAAKNYGWPVISYGKEYYAPIQVGEGTEKVGMEQPIKEYTPSIAPSSLLCYSGAAFSDWNGNLLSGALKLQHVNRIELNKTKNAVTKETRMLSTLKERIRDIIADSQGLIYISTDSGKIIKVSPR